MLRKDLIPKSPVIQILGRENLEKGRFGAVVSRAGVGKTQFLVQIAICWLLDGKKVIHVSLDDPIEKINLRYREGYTNLIDSVGYIDPIKANRLWEDIDTCKLGISYNETTFSSGNIREYLTSLRKENLELPAMMVIDGIDFNKDNTALLDEIKTLSDDFSLSVWFSIQSHREEEVTADGFPPQLDKVREWFDKALFLNPQEDKIKIVVLKDGESENNTFLLNPATMMKS
jgi:hypothetical protein